MPSTRIFAVSVSTLVFLAGCQSTEIPSNEALDASVAVMTRNDVTVAPDAPARAVIDRSKGYRATVRSAVLENQEFAASIRRYKEASASIRVAQSGTRPQIVGGMTAGGVVEDSDVTGGVAADLSLSQLIFDGGKIRANISGATALAYAARADVNVLGNEIGGRAAMAWIDLWQSNAQLALVQGRIDDVDPLIRQIGSLIASGMVDRAALAAAQRQFLDLSLEKDKVQTDLRNAQERFNRYYGERPRSVPPPQRLFSEAELAQMAKAWQDSPTLIAAAAELIAAEYAVESARAELRPTVSARAGLNSPLDRNDNPTATVGFVVRYTFGDGGRRKAEISRLDERLQAGRASFEDAKSSVLVEVESALSQHKTLRGTLSVLSAQIRELDTERNTLKSQISSGQANMRQLVESEVLYYRAQARQIEAQGELRALEIGLAAATGQLINKLSIDIDALL